MLVPGKAGESGRILGGLGWRKGSLGRREGSLYRKRGSVLEEASSDQEKEVWTKGKGNQGREEGCVT